MLSVWCQIKLLNIVKTGLTKSYKIVLYYIILSYKISVTCIYIYIQHKHLGRSFPWYLWYATRKSKINLGKKNTYCVPRVLFFILCSSCAHIKPVNARCACRVIKLNFDYWISKKKNGSVSKNGHVSPAYKRVRCDYVQ